MSRKQAKRAAFYYRSKHAPRRFFRLAGGLMCLGGSDSTNYGYITWIRPPTHEEQIVLHGPVSAGDMERSGFTWRKSEDCYVSADGAVRVIGLTQRLKVKNLEPELILINVWMNDPSRALDDVPPLFGGGLDDEAQDH